jgi:uncharacterized NAD(P)/FAD-binding protein YdhS
MLSRRGVFPLPHDLTHQAISITVPENYSPRKMLLWVRYLMRKNPEVPWSVIIDGLRPYTQKIWLQWIVSDKQYFLKKIRPYWEIARHRIPSASSEQLNNMMEKGQLVLKKGTIEEASVSSNGIEILYRSESRLNSQVFQKVINCTGPESNYRKVRFPIIVDLIARGKVKIDELGLGIKCTPEGRIINDQGEVEQGIWCIGPMRKAVLWETTALRELRDQSSALAAMMEQ